MTSDSRVNEVNLLDRLDYVELGFRPISRDRTTWKSAGIRGAGCPSRSRPRPQIIELAKIRRKTLIPTPATSMPNWIGQGSTWTSATDPKLSILITVESDDASG